MGMGMGIINQINFACQHQNYQKFNHIKSFESQLKTGIAESLGEPLLINFAQTFDQRQFNFWRVYIPSELRAVIATFERIIITAQDAGWWPADAPDLHDQEWVATQSIKARSDLFPKLGRKGFSRQKQDSLDPAQWFQLPPDGIVPTIIKAIYQGKIRSISKTSQKRLFKTKTR